MHRIISSERLAGMEFSEGKVVLFGGNLKVNDANGRVHVCESVHAFAWLIHCMWVGGW